MSSPVMLAAKDSADLTKVQFPVLVSYKLDGVRAYVRDAVVYSRRCIPIPNAHVQKLFGKARFNGLDGELIVGAPNAGDVFRQTMSGVTSHDGRPDVKFHVFDYNAAPFAHQTYRVRLLQAKKRSIGNRNIVSVQQVIRPSPASVETMEEQALREGYEGLILRDPLAPYKFGRSTHKEGYLLRIKRFTHTEAEIVGFQEEMFNGNGLDARGKRTSHKVGKVGKGTLGALLVRNLETAQEHKVFGFTDEDAARFWGARKRLMGKVIRCKSFPVGVKDKPRHATFAGFREEFDL